MIFIYFKDDLLKLLERIIDKDTKAFNLFYNKTYSFVFNIALSVLCNYDYANDVSQNIYIKIFQITEDKLPKYNTISWLRVVIRNEAISFIRNEKKTENTDEYLNVISPTIFENELLDIMSFDYILRYLSNDECEIIILKIANNFSHKEIAKIMSIPQGTVRWKYSQALKKLREKLGDEYK